MISIIIPAYNSSATIVEALESVLAQSLWASSVERGVPRVESNTESQSFSALGTSRSLLLAQYEVIIVDDCSTDNTVEVVQQWIKEKILDPCEAPVVTGVSPVVSWEGQDAADTAATTEERYLRSDVYGLWSIVSLRSNAGPAGARNAGIAAAKGDWIAFLDADDIWLPGKLELQMRLAAEHPEVVLWCGEVGCFEGASGLQIIDHRPQTLDQSEAQKSNVYGLTSKVLSPVALETFAVRNPVATSTVLVKREVLIAVGGFDPQFRGPEDYDLWIRVAALPDTTGIVHIAVPLALCRRVVGSLSTDDRKFLQQVFRVLDKAFGPDGGLSHYLHLKGGALASQYWSGSWMAFSRGSRLDAIRLWGKAWWLAFRATPRMKRPWFRMLIRYCCLPKPH